MYAQICSAEFQCVQMCLQMFSDVFRCLPMCAQMCVQVLYQMCPDLRCAQMYAQMCARMCVQMCSDVCVFIVFRCVLRCARSPSRSRTDLGDLGRGDGIFFLYTRLSPATISATPAAVRLPNHSGRFRIDLCGLGRRSRFLERRSPLRLF